MFGISLYQIVLQMLCVLPDHEKQTCSKIWSSQSKSLECYFARIGRLLSMHPWKVYIGFLSAKIRGLFSPKTTDVTQVQELSILLTEFETKEACIIIKIHSFVSRRVDTDTEEDEKAEWCTVKRCTNIDMLFSSLFILLWKDYG